ncbi:MAG: ABC transporter ATP-binding protein [Candidatus Paceibacterota bacterium]|jgi:putative ABC transport system ATP-binding protein
MIDLKNVSKIYTDGGETIALDSVSFKIEKGEFVSIMGPSGSGKSTLLHILSFMDTPTSGVYTFDGKNVNDLNQTDFAHLRNARMGFVFQAFNLLGRQTVYQNVELPLMYNDIPRAERKKRIEKAIHEVGLDDKTNAEAATLSGGQKQRVAIARALVCEPDIIFADEPTGNLDSKSGAQVMSILAGLNKAGHTVILVTHEKSTASFANRLIQVKDGRIESDTRIQSIQEMNELIK